MWDVFSLIGQPKQKNFLNNVQLFLSLKQQGESLPCTLVILMETCLGFEVNDKSSSSRKGTYTINFKSGAEENNCMSGKVKGCRLQ